MPGLASGSHVAVPLALEIVGCCERSREHGRGRCWSSNPLERARDLEPVTVDISSSPSPDPQYRFLKTREPPPPAPASGLAGASFDAPAASRRGLTSCASRPAGWCAEDGDRQGSKGSPRPLCTAPPKSPGGKPRVGRRRRRGIWSASVKLSLSGSSPAVVDRHGVHHPPDGCVCTQR